MEKKNRTKSPRLEELIPDEGRRKDVIERLYRGDPIVGSNGIFTDLLQALVNASLEGEMDYHLDESKSSGQVNRRNGKNIKHVRSRVGPLDVRTPRDRQGTYEPTLIGKWDRELSTGMDELIIGLYAKGHSVEDVRYQLRQLYGIEISAGTISAVTDRVMDEILQWQQRPLEPCYPIIYLDAIHYKVRQDGTYQSKAIYSVYGINVHGERDLLGMYLGESEGSRQWGLLLEDLKCRGVEDVFIFCVDGLKGFKEVIQEVFPESILQRCIVHMIRSSTRFVSYKHIRAVCSDLRKIYSSANREQALVALQSFMSKWDSKYKEIGKKWEENWDELMSFMEFSSQIRRMVYTTNPVEALHRVMRKVTKSKGAWINDKALLKQLYLTLMHSQKSWKRSAFQWMPIQRDLLDYYKDRYGKYL
jgi:transposase-like protein